ncbi:MAG TPA: hypothetical protein VGS07_29080 [Thermoanaerobaculia bacterium]|jgi:hypothetical protein|nr:hypothetical protein [Thermoanaerobaculia bacterium]
MKKLVKDKLALNRETLRTLTGLDMFDAKGGKTTDLCTTETSNPTATCDTCIGPSCRAGGTATSANCTC